MRVALHRLRPCRGATRCSPAFQCPWSRRSEHCALHRRTGCMGSPAATLAPAFIAILDLLKVDLRPTFACFLNKKAKPLRETCSPSVTGKLSLKLWPFLVHPPVFSNDHGAARGVKANCWHCGWHRRQRGAVSVALGDMVCTHCLTSPPKPVDHLSWWSLRIESPLLCMHACWSSCGYETNQVSTCLAGWR